MPSESLSLERSRDSEEVDADPESSDSWAAGAGASVFSSLTLADDLLDDPLDCCALIAETRSPLRMADAPEIPIDPASFLSSGSSMVDRPPLFLPESLALADSAMAVDSVTLFRSSFRDGWRTDQTVRMISFAPQTVRRFWFGEILFGLQSS